MGRILMMLEVSRKQDYIFASRKLRENLTRSRKISHVTGSGFFREAAGEIYDEEQNLVYAGGGHTVLQFPHAQAARAFARRVTEAVLRRYDGMEMFVKCLPYDERKLPWENLEALSSALEAKKALRKGAFRQMSVGVEALDQELNRPQLPACEDAGRGEDVGRGEDGYPLPAPWKFPLEFSQLAGEDRFIAVIHIDGNAMGKRVAGLGAGPDMGWEAYRRRLRQFSEGIQEDFTQAFRKTVEAVMKLPGLDKAVLPVRPVILAGDDVCFVSAGAIALECACTFLKALAALKNKEDGKPYAACAGVAIVHQKYPFHLAYRLSEELCASAKRFGASLDPQGRVCALDWHIEFGQLKDSLASLRLDYNTEDGNRLELRPLAVKTPEGIDPGLRTWDFFRAMCLKLQEEQGEIARSKIKQLRTAFKQGEAESSYFLQEKQIRKLLYHSGEAAHPGEAERWAWYRALLMGEEKMELKAFRAMGGVKRCLFFDALEIMDNCRFFEEVSP